MACVQGYVLCCEDEEQEPNKMHHLGVFTIAGIYDCDNCLIIQADINHLAPPGMPPGDTGHDHRHELLLALVAVA